MSRTFAIGDIHGCSKTLDSLINQKLKLVSGDTVYFLGDYVDRGPDSKGVIDQILNLKSSGINIKPLLGNHEFMLLETIEKPMTLAQWTLNGCKETLKSFDIRFPDALEPHYINFFKSLQYYYIYNNYILVHGGLNFEIDNPLDDLDAMLWTRNKRIDTSKIQGKSIIVGHTPTPLTDIENSLTTNKIMLDGGCVYYGMYEEMGNLCALDLDKMILYHQLNIEMNR